MRPATPLLLQRDVANDEKFWSAAYRCPGCHNLNVARQWYDPWADVDDGGTYNSTLDAAADFKWAAGRVLWVPRFGEREAFPDVPAHIASAASEATMCFSLGAYRAVGALARAVVEATAKDKKATGANLAARIDQLKESGHVRPLVQEAAHEVRHFGNTIAHGDFADATTKEEAAEALELMREVLAEVYQAPARVLAAQTRRQGAKDGPTT